MTIEAIRAEAAVGLVVLPAQELFRLRKDAVMTVSEDGAVQLRQSRFVLRLGALPLGQRSMLLRLSEGWQGEFELSQGVAALDGENRVLSAQLLIRRLVAHSWLGRRLSTPGRPLVEMIPRGLGQGSQPTTHRHEDGISYVLSRFASLVPDDGQLVVSTPAGRTRVACLDPAVTACLVQGAAEGITPKDIARRSGVDPDTAGRVLDELLTAQVLISPAERSAEQQQPLAVWSLPELLLHQRSRPGACAEPIGGTYRLEGSIPAPPLVRTFPGTDAIDLDVPASPAGEMDPTLTDVIGRRRTVRDHDEQHPLSLQQLGEFLYRVQRLTPLGESHGQELGARPYPVGGAICELEVYAVVSRCAGLDPGAYHYDSAGHRLEVLAGDVPAVTRMLDYARAAATSTARPQVLLVIASRVDRLLWKYEGIGYAMTLKHSGVLTELMYLVATAMGLAPCALGAGDGDAFAAATGLDPLVEPSIAEFMLGTIAPADELERPE